LSEYELWCSRQIAALIAAMSKIHQPLGGDTIARGLERHLGVHKSVNLSSVAEATGFSRRSICTWIAGSTRLRVESFFRICFALKITPLSLLGYRAADGRNEEWPNESFGIDGEAGVLIRPTKRRPGRPRNDRRTPVSQAECWSKSNLAQLKYALETAVQAGRYVSPREIARQFGYSSPDRVLRRFKDLCEVLNARAEDDAEAKRARVRKRLDSALLEWPPPTLRRLAKELKTSTSSALRSVEPHLCDQIMARRNAMQRTRYEEVKSILELALQREHIPSLKKFCEQNGIAISMVILRCPEQKKAYEARYMELKEAERCIRSKQFESEVNAAVSTIRERGGYPSVGQVLSENVNLRHAGWDKLQRAIQKALEIGPDETE
jgi:transcriptional regulator with XRE-family HTH domain